MVVNAFSALSDDTRRDIVHLVARRGELASTEIGANFSMSAPAISQHLKILRDARILQMRKEAQRRIYSIDEAGFGEVESWLADVRKLWTRRLNRLDAHLQKKKKERTDGKR